jgi:chemotaxis protein MotB
MRRKKKQTPHSNHERWLVSYADFITLLFAFFVVLYASSQIDKHRVGQLAQAIQAAFQELGVFQQSSSRIPVLTPEQLKELERDAVRKQAEAGGIPVHMSGSGLDVKKLLRDLQDVLAPEIKRQEIRVREGPDGVVLSLQEVGFYDPGSDQLRPGAGAIISRLVPIISSYGGNLRIEGHTDDVPIHNARFASNWELSTARATGLIRLFIDQYKFEPKRLAAAGYAEFHPVAANSPEGRRMNRRVDIVILPPNPLLSPTEPAAAVDPRAVARSLGSPPPLKPAPHN